VPFFSRRIGLHEGSQIPVVFGAKVFGKVGDTNIALLDVRTRAASYVDEETEESIPLPRNNFIAARLSRNILAESKVGLIFTDGSPVGGRNTLAGADLTYQTSRFMGDRNFLLGGWWVYNWNTIKGGHHQGFGFKLDYPNDLWDLAATYAYYGDALDPGLGFLSRNAVQNLNLGINYQPRPEKGLVGRLVRQWFFEFRPTFYWDLGGRLETRRLFFAPVNLRTEGGERFEFNVIPNRDVLPVPFEVSEGVILPAGSYDFTSYRVELGSASHRPWVVNGSWRFGGFYTGRYDDLELGLALKFNGYATFAFDANFVRGRLPQGHFKENVYQIKADLFLSPDLGLKTYIQYDDVSNLLGASFRFRWRITPGNEIFVVYNKNWERRWDPMSRFVPLEERGVFKISLSVRP
jgi:hypothetical protein